MSKYPVLAFILRIGMAGMVGVGLLATLLIAWVLFPLLGSVQASVIAGAVGGILTVVAMSYVELIRLITDMLLPQ